MDGLGPGIDSSESAFRYVARALPGWTNDRRSKTTRVGSFAFRVDTSARQYCMIAAGSPRDAAFAMTSTPAVSQR